MSDDAMEFLSAQETGDNKRELYGCESGIGEPDCDAPATYIVASCTRNTIIYVCDEHVKPFRRMKLTIPLMATISIEPISG
jgi:hypothetical protein